MSGNTSVHCGEPLQVLAEFRGADIEQSPTPRGYHTLPIDDDREWHGAHAKRPRDIHFLVDKDWHRVTVFRHERLDRLLARSID
jgi:hypothetical protein